jgi:hypothetical protein
MYFSDADSSFTAHLEKNRQFPEILNFTLCYFSNFYSVSFRFHFNPIVPQ